MMMMSRRSDEGESPDTDAACGADHGGQKKKKKKKKKKTTTKEGEVEGEGTEPTQQDGRNRNNTRLARIRKARSVRSVYWALCPEARYEGTGMSMRSGAAAARLHRRLHPLLAAAALRRVADLRGRGMAYRRRRRKGQAPVVQPAADRWDEAEGELARAIVLPPLLRSAGGAVLDDVRSMAARAAAAAPDAAVDGKSDAAEDPADSARRQLGPQSLLDVLYGLARLADVKKRAAAAASSSSSTGGGGGIGTAAGDGFRPLAAATCQAIASDDGGASYVSGLWHTSLVETAWSVAVLGLGEEADAAGLLNAIGERLARGDAVGRLTGRQLGTVLWSYAVLDFPHQGLMKAVMRRMRKTRRELFASDVARALWSAARLVERLDDEAELEQEEEDGLDIASAQLREEAVVLFHTLSNELSPASGDSAKLARLLDLTAGAAADIVMSSVALEIGPEVPILSALSCHLRQPSVVKNCSLQDIARLLLSFHRLGLREERETIRSLCHRFAELARTNDCDGKTLNTVLRSVVMLRAADDAACASVFDVATSIINDTDRGMAMCSRCSEFEVSAIAWSFAKAKYVDDGVIRRLASRMMALTEDVSPSSISRMLWSYTVLLSLADDSHSDDNMPIDVGQRLAELRETQYLLFQSMSWVLLSEQLNPIDCTAAMWAMAQASYPLDLSVFDHLAESLARDDMLERSSTECISQALWSCGKMSTWEGLQQGHSGEPSLAPYMASAEKYATNLLSRKEDMSPKDVAQTIWSLGKLSEAIIIGEEYKGFVSLAVCLANSFNGIEIASILYGLARLGYNEDDRVIDALVTSRFLETSVLARSTAREISSVMFSLGMMGHRNPKLFAKLSTAMMEGNVDETSSESIANALTAYEAVDMAPPRILFDRWASEKLGIMARHSFISSIVGDAVASPAEAVHSETSLELLS